MKKVKILVVDDDPRLSRLVKLTLEKSGGFEVCEENRSANALAAARAFGPEMFILDIDMPGKDGGQVAMELQADAKFSKCPILFLSSLVSTEEAGEREVYRGGKIYLAKPVEPMALIEAVERIVARHAASASGPHSAASAA